MITLDSGYGYDVSNLDRYLNKKKKTSRQPSDLYHYRIVNIGLIFDNDVLKSVTPPVTQLRHPIDRLQFLTENHFRMIVQTTFRQTYKNQIITITVVLLFYFFGWDTHVT